jgi:endonuclease/exonuclease/phosphatase family metal-dependent hydrolase
MPTPPGRIPQDISSDNQHLVTELRRFATIEELRRSEFYRSHEAELKQLLDGPRIFRFSNAKPRLTSFLRVVEWNIERGTRLQGIIDVLNTHPVLQFADLLLLNELDEGMVRSGNARVAQELCQALAAHTVFGVEYLELTKGPEKELTVDGENTTALHGNAILTRHGFSNPQLVRLPRCENNFESRERRLGGRIGIILDMEVGGTSFAIGNTHLDVVNTPSCRGRQMSAMLQAIDARLGTQNDPCRRTIVGGDLNTHTFARGTRFRAFWNTATILNSNRERLRRRLSHPEVTEPAIREFAKFGYKTGGFNDGSFTSRTIVSNLDDPSRLPGPMKWWINRRVGPRGLLLEFRLDWLAGRGVRALKAGEVVDRETGVESVDAQTFLGLQDPQGSPLSDHDPIVVDIALD